MNLTAQETRFLTALAREQNQTGCRGPAHELLREHAYPQVPREGPGSLAFSYEVVPLTAILLAKFKDLGEIDDFLCKDESIADPTWPWFSPDEFWARLAEAKKSAATEQVPVA